MKKFPTMLTNKKSDVFTQEKSRTKQNNNGLRLMAKKKADKYTSIFTYEYQESDLEQFVY